MLFAFAQRNLFRQPWVRNLLVSLIKLGYSDLCPSWAGAMPAKGGSRAHQGHRPREDKDEATDHGRGGRMSGNSRACANSTRTFQERSKLRTQLRHGLWTAALQRAGQDQCRERQAFGSGLE